MNKFTKKELKCLAAPFGDIENEKVTMFDINFNKDLVTPNLYDISFDDMNIESLTIYDSDGNIAHVFESFEDLCKYEHKMENSYADKFPKIYPKVKFIEVENFPQEKSPIKMKHTHEKKHMKPIKINHK